MPQDGLLPVRVLSRRTPTPCVVVLQLAALDGGALPPFAPGAHVDLHLADGLARPYSLCGDPADRSRYTLAILRDPTSRGGAIAAHALAEQAVVRISPPRSNFPLDEAAPRSILIGGGIGITPLLSMAWRLAALGADLALHYCVRRRADAALLAEAAAAPFAPALRLHVSSEQRFGVARDLPPADPGTRIYLCGPLAFMEAVQEALHAAGWAPAQIATERFVAGSPADDAPADTFSVTLASSGARFAIGPGETIAQVLTRNGIELALSCEQGMCGTCLVGVLDGIPDHRDAYQSAREKAANTQIALCCSRARTDNLLLDL